MPIQVFQLYQEPEFFSSAAAPHSSSSCPGNCSQHPWLTAELSSMMYLESTWGFRWGDLFAEDLAALDAKSQSPEALAAAAKKASAAAAERLAFEQKVVADRNAIRAGLTRNKHGQAQIQKIAQPCKKLYSCQPGARCGAEPTTKHVSSECWAHEYRDAASGLVIKKHCCQWLHPGEEGWLPQWNTDRTYRLDRVGSGLAALRGVVPEAPRAAPSRFGPTANQRAQAEARRPAPKNPFAALEDNSAW